MKQPVTGTSVYLTYMDPIPDKKNPEATFWLLNKFAFLHKCVGHDNSLCYILATNRGLLMRESYRSVFFIIAKYYDDLQVVCYDR